MRQMLLYAAIGTGFCFLMTTLGSAMVFLNRKRTNKRFQALMLGLAGGVMMAAVVWSLIMPALEWSDQPLWLSWLAVFGGLILGIGFLLVIDLAMPVDDHFSLQQKKNRLLFLSITLHNIPEGMAVGLSIAMACLTNEHITLLGTFMLALGVGIQNFPEGSAISLPYRQNGCSTRQAFLYGMVSGVVEPLFGILVVFIAQPMQALLPWILSFAAGTMIYVVVKEIIPEAHEHRRLDFGTIGFMIGFLIMMSLDILLG